MRFSTNFSTLINIFVVKRRTAHTNTCTRTNIKRHTDTKPHAHMYTRCCCCFWEQQFYCCCCCFAHQRLDDLRSRRFAKLCTLFVCKYASHLRCMYICFQLPFVKLIACIQFIAAYSLFFHQTTHKFSHKYATHYSEHTTHLSTDCAHV